MFEPLAWWNRHHDWTLYITIHFQDLYASILYPKEKFSTTRSFHVAHKPYLYRNQLQKMLNKGELIKMAASLESQWMAVNFLSHGNGQPE